jgi:hypothetical protein
LVSIWNLRGQLLYHQPAPNSPLVLPVDAWPSGMYQVRAGAQRARFLKQ